MPADIATAQALFRSGKTAEAANLCRQLLSVNPRDAGGNYLMGAILLQSQLFSDAEHYAKMAVVTDSRNSSAHMLLGDVYLSQGNRTEAAKAFDRALAVGPQDMEAFRARMKIAFDDKDFATAERILEPLLDRFTDMPDMLAMAVRVKKELKKYGQVVKLGDHLLKIDPNYKDPQFFIRYALALEEVGRLDESVKYHEYVLGLIEAEPAQTEENEKARAEINYNIGLAHESKGEFDAAKRHYEKALSINPEHHTCRFAYETLLIKVTDLNRDLSSFSMRFLIKERQQRKYPWPEWQGEPLEGKKLLVWGEQGIGDVAMFSGFLPHVLTKVSFLMIDMFDYLVPIYARSFPGVPVAAFGNDFTPSKESLQYDFDYHAPMGALMIHFLKEYKPCTVKGYLKPGPERLAQLKERYAQLGKGLKVGISWRTVHPHSRFRRDIPLDQWGPILTTPGCHFISLQYSNEEAELEYVKKKLGVDILLDKDVKPLESRDDFITQIAAMDLVVSIQNSAVHMGGASGTDTILMLSRASDFRWGVTRNDSVWYPTVSIVRQPQYGDWSPVIERAAKMVKERAGT